LCGSLGEENLKRPDAHIPKRVSISIESWSQFLGEGNINPIQVTDDRLCLKPNRDHCRSKVKEVKVNKFIII